MHMASTNRISRISKNLNGKMSTESRYSCVAELVIHKSFSCVYTTVLYSHEK